MSQFKVGDIVSGYRRNTLFKIDKIELRGKTSPLLKGYIYDPLKKTLGKALHSWDEGYSKSAKDYVSWQIEQAKAELEKWEKTLQTL